MKNILLSIFIILILNSCSTSPSVSPSQNSALSSITKAKKAKENGSMQKALDNWIKDDWTPTVEKDKDIKNKNSDIERDFKLQEYADKIAVYMRENNSSKEPSHYEKINSMPVIGKKK